MSRVTVPKTAGDTLILTIAGEPKTYAVSNGATDVEPGDLDVFLLNVDGSAVDDDESSASGTPAAPDATQPGKTSAKKES